MKWHTNTIASGFAKIVTILDWTMASKKKGVRWSKSHDEKISALFDSGEADPYNQEVDSILEVYNNNSWIGEVYPVPHQFYSIYRAKASKYITAKEAEGTRGGGKCGVFLLQFSC